MTGVLLPYPVSANLYWRHVRRPLRTLVVLSDEAKEYRRVVSAICAKCGIRPLVGDVELWVELHPRLTQRGVASERRIDLDNALKVAFDALQGSMFETDRQVVSLHARIAGPLRDGGLSVRCAPAHSQD